MSKSRLRRIPQLRGPLLLAGWQRMLLWVAWLGFFGLCIAHSDRGEPTFSEFLALIAAVAITAGCLKYPAGPPKVTITTPEMLRGEFMSRTNWPLVLLGLALTFGGLAGAAKIWHDLANGFTTVWGVFADFFLFFIEMFIERVSKGVEGDVTHTKLYILVFLLPIGPLLIFYNLLPWLFSGQRFRIDVRGQVTVLTKGRWQPLAPRNYQTVISDEITIEFTQPSAGSSEVELPRMRVYSCELGTQVPSQVISAFFVQQLEEAGFVRDTTVSILKKSWVYRRECR